MHESGSTVINEDSSEIEAKEEEESGCRSKSTTPETSAGIKGKKRKGTQEEVMESVVGKVMKAVMEGLKESDKMFVELEEKRMKFEQQQKREERQFQLQMMQMLLGSSHQTHPHADHRAPFFPRFPPYGDSYFNPYGDTDSR